MNKDHAGKTILEWINEFLEFQKGNSTLGFETGVYKFSALEQGFSLDDIDLAVNHFNNDGLYLYL